MPLYLFAAIPPGVYIVRGRDKLTAAEALLEYLRREGVAPDQLSRPEFRDSRSLPARWLEELTLDGPTEVQEVVPA